MYVVFLISKLDFEAHIFKPSTPMYQVLTHALADKANKTKFSLIFANVTSKDIILREELDALKTQYPDTINVVYTLDKPDKDWKGELFHMRAFRHSTTRAERLYPL